MFLANILKVRSQRVRSKTGLFLEIEQHNTPTEDGKLIKTLSCGVEEELVIETPKRIFIFLIAKNDRKIRVFRCGQN